MSTCGPEKISQIVDEIERYWDDHPEAADTLESIVRWWLPRQRIEESVHVVALAVSELVRKGAIEEQMTPDGRRVYRRTQISR
jgi:hypothetical protein